MSSLKNHNNNNNWHSPMASSFAELLPSDGASHKKKLSLPSYICHDPRSVASSKHKSEKSTVRNGSSASQFKRPGSASERSNSRSLVVEDSRMDEVAIGAVMKILSGYIGRYVKDELFRRKIRERCSSVMERRREDSNDEVFENLEMGMGKVDKLVEDHGRMRQVMLIKSLKNSIEILTIIVASSLNAKDSHLSACAQIYLAIAYKMLKKESFLKAFTSSVL
ncbi:hypothetical protein S83_011437 [Arachis hypogaea]